jgi:uracil-DNA glycosylase
LWGSPAHKKAKNVDPKKHHILKSVHPSPLSSYRGFFGCKHFSLCNQFLKSKKIEVINWKVD